jgi:DNA polymerase-3 subunit epsilon
VSGLTGIDAALVAEAPPFERIADHVRQHLEGRVFVAHNVGFDWRFVAEEMRRARAVMPSGPRLCTVRLARRALPGVRRRGLDSLARHYDVEILGRHRAGGDARATAEILLRLLEQADRGGIRDWKQLDVWLAGLPAELEGSPGAGRERSAHE